MMRPIASLALAGAALLIMSMSAALADSRVSLGGVSLGTGVLSVVKEFGPPGLVQTTDDGNEWRWYDATGIDVDLLTDDALVVRQILVSRPEPVGGKPSKLVQLREFPLLEETSTAADAWMRSSGAIRQAEPEAGISAWHVGDDLVVLELRQGKVNKILALDPTAAANLGYVAGGSAPRHHAPRLLDQFPVNYPKRALERRAEGVVVVQVDVTGTGGVSKVLVLVSSGDPDIDAAESLSMRKSRFDPARCEGQPCGGIYLDREEYTLEP
jgi:TonB family protein